MRVIKAWLIKLIIMSLMILLSSSSFFLDPYLTKIISKGKASDSQLSFGLNIKNESSLVLAINQSIIGTRQWLSLKVKLANQQGQAAYELARWYNKKITQKDKTDNHINRKEAIKWYQQSIRFDNEKAKIYLALLYLSEGDTQQTQWLLSNVDHTDNLEIEAELMNARVRLAIELGETELVLSLLQEKYDLLLISESGLELFKIITRYQIVTYPIGTENENKAFHYSVSNVDILDFTALNCKTSIQLFGSSLGDLVHIEQLQAEFMLSPMAEFVCIGTPRYIPKNSLDCTSNKVSPITCNEIFWESIAENTPTRHIGYMNKQGGANVHLGILYFDREDNVDVLSHEISHLLGFVDEYAMSKNHKVCKTIQKSPFSLNISVLKSNRAGNRQNVRKAILAELSWANSINASTPILTRGVNNWIVGTPNSHREEVGLFRAQSCVNSEEANKEGFSAYKPIRRSTQLEFYVEIFPKEYIEQIRTQSQKYMMPSFHYNIALALYKSGNLSKAKYWLKQSSLWESDPVRENKVLNGAW
jgi:hypothetical protein